MRRIDLHNCRLAAIVLILWNYNFHIFVWKFSLAAAHENAKKSLTCQVVKCEHKTIEFIRANNGCSLRHCNRNCDRVMLINLSIILLYFSFIDAFHPPANHWFLFVSMSSFDIYYLVFINFSIEHIHISKHDRLTTSIISIWYRNISHPSNQPTSLMRRREMQKIRYLTLKCALNETMASFVCSAESKLPFYIFVCEFLRCLRFRFHSKRDFIATTAAAVCITNRFFLSGFICLDLNAFSFVSAVLSV